MARCFTDDNMKCLLLSNFKSTADNVCARVHGRDMWVINAVLFQLQFSSVTNFWFGLSVSFLSLANGTFIGAVAGQTDTLNGHVVWVLCGDFIEQRLFFDHFVRREQLSASLRSSIVHTWCWMHAVSIRDILAFFAYAQSRQFIWTWNLIDSRVCSDCRLNYANTQHTKSNDRYRGKLSLLAACSASIFKFSFALHMELVADSNWRAKNRRAGRQTNSNVDRKLWLISITVAGIVGWVVCVRVYISRAPLNQC